MRTLLHILLVSTLLSLSISERCNPHDKKALFQIKESFGNPYHLTSWKPEADCCTSWYEVKCDRTTNRIISLTIFAGNLSGQIPPQVGDLPYLQTLRFHKLTNVTGPVQPTIAKLTNLRTLDLSWLSLTGPVPDFLGNFKNLFFLDLSFNKLSGSIPSSLSKLQNANSIILGRNQLTGVIPDSFGTFQGTTPDLYLSHNQLSGKIPVSLGYLNFTSIDLSHNQLEGDASMLFGPNKTIQIVHLSRNVLEFDLTKVVFPDSLTSLEINHNKIYGSIPEKMTQLNVYFLNVSYNRLCGQIPVGGNLQSFDSFSYFHNRCLCGAPLDSCK